MKLTSVFAALALPLVALANPHAGAKHARHAEIAKRASGHVDIHKRYSDARWTFYKTGLGACGLYNNDGDFIVALNSAQYGGGYPGPNCFKKIVMTYGGKTTTATITDECPGCPYGGLDLSPGLFSFFADQGKGVIQGSWYFAGEGGGSPAPPKTTPKPKPTTTWKPAPKPTTTWKPEPTTTWKPEPTTTKKTTTSSTADPTTSKSSTSTKASSSAAPTPSTPAAGNNFDIFNGIMLNLGGIAIAGAAVNAA
jgi:hypothetical protein